MNPDSEESLCAQSSDTPDNQDAVKPHFEIGSINLLNKSLKHVEFRNVTPVSEIQRPQGTIASSQLVVRPDLKISTFSFYETYLLSYLLFCLMYSGASELNVSCYRYNMFDGIKTT